MMKIVFCHLLNDFSGSPKVLRDTISALKGEAKNEKLYVSGNTDGFLSDCQISRGRYWYIRSQNKFVTLFTFFFSQVCLFFKLLCDRSIASDAIIYVNTLLPFGAAIYGKLTGRLVIYHVHEISIRPAPLRYFLVSLVRWTSSLNMYVSKAHMQLLPIPGVKSRCIYNALDHFFEEKGWSSVYQSHRQGVFNILMIASLRDYKGIVELIALVNSLSGRIDIHFDLVINGDQCEIDAYFSDTSCPSQLTVHPRTLNTPAYYAEASLVLSLARVDLWQETFGLTVLEAITFGIPVIVPPVGGPAEIIRDGVEGFLIDSRDTDRVRTHVLRLVDDAVLCHRMSEAARLRAKDFMRDKFIAEMNAVIMDIRASRSATIRNE
ncbi:glycosyltransferase family 4 protein [Janthinobacterium sp. GW458P]|uniref:glycosyltransferase family 4 protein n=1 Tax=Janthinobacterium sp. GW458P TaxID=1981504 RepID=UPI000A31FB42|nr:glycosyltransferase family 4 protein [Janthinobacterium sp. GW458P]MBE3023614.1 glycosyltransferase family 4 protein [Janthinobacterium sp. GW458P]